MTHRGRPAANERVAHHRRPHDHGDDGMSMPMDTMYGMESMAGMDPRRMFLAMRRKFLWLYFTNVFLGLWLLGSAASFDYNDDAMLASDIVSGVLATAFALLALHPRGDFWGRWGVCAVGVWLLFAPLVFWAPSAAVYMNDSIVGILLIGFSVLAPMMPGEAHHQAMMQPGPDLPPGWTYNPSTFWQRGIVIALGAVSFLIARYMAAYQLGHIGSALDPFFGDGTEEILTSDVSRAWPVSDAGLGAATYALEALSGFMGSTRRWRSMPWMVLMFFVLVVPLGTVSITLVIMQPVMVGTWCTLCLVTAAFMLLMIPLALDEIFAMVQYMLDARRRGKPLWRTFWVGGTMEGGSPDERSPKYVAPDPSAVPPMVWGVSVPWNLAAMAALGLWVMVAPYPFGADLTPAGDAYHLIGALTVTIAVIAFAEVARPLRFAVLAVAPALAAASWLLSGGDTWFGLHGLIVAALIVPLALPRGPVRERYGGWDAYVV